MKCDSKNELYLRLALYINNEMFKDNYISLSVYEYTQKQLLKMIKKSGGEIGFI